MTASRSRLVLAGLPREVGGILRRHWVAAVPPAALLGALAGTLVLVRHDLGGEILIGLLLAVMFEIYVGYAEVIVAADRSTGPRPPIATMLRRALPMTVPLVLASLVAVSVPVAATGLLVIPGFWLLTIWSLFAPVIVHEKLGVRASLTRSRALVRGAFWAVAASVSLSVLVEHGVIHAAAHTTTDAAGSTLLGLAGAALATALVSGPAAFTISVVYERLAGDVRASPPHGGVHPRPADAPQSRSAMSHDLRS